MKNQNDMIISVVAIVLGIIGFCIGFFTKRQVSPPAAPAAVILTPPALQGAEVKMVGSLPGGGGGPGFAAAGAAPRPAGGSGPSAASPGSFGVGGRGGGGGAPAGAGAARE